ncbi:MAG TPA: metalloregulator ArsR/SmtB family transcription factor [Rhizomicrobium sp.]|jgi:DNA-binding transcriptional ArsR family regulator|nr:metalloregulator ArsR/SmtB family transcription factor [Rhizomicrobium sp.]
MRKHPALPLFRILGVPLRVVIFQRLARKPATASELAHELPITRTAVVQHLTVLRRHGLVDAAALGRSRVYRTMPAGLRPLRDWLNHHEHIPIAKQK